MATSRIDLEWAPTLAEAATYGVPTNLNQTTSRNGVALTWNDAGNLTAYGSTTYEWASAIVWPGCSSPAPRPNTPTTARTGARW